MTSANRPGASPSICSRVVTARQRLGVRWVRGEGIHRVRFGSTASHPKRCQPRSPLHPPQCRYGGRAATALQNLAAIRTVHPGKSRWNHEIRERHEAAEIWGKQRAHRTGGHCSFLMFLLSRVSGKKAR